MKASRIIAIVIIGGLLFLYLDQVGKNQKLRREYAQMAEESRLRELDGPQKPDVPQVTAEPNPGPAAAAIQTQLQTRVQELETEVVRLRGVAGRAVRAEAEAEQLRKVLTFAQSTGNKIGEDMNSISNNIFSYLGEPVAPPSNLASAYTQAGLQGAIQQAANLVGVSLKKIEIDSSEYPYLAGFVCQNSEDADKLAAQLRKLSNYTHAGATSGNGAYAINITPSDAYPPEDRDRINRRTILRLQMFHNQLTQKP